MTDEELSKTPIGHLYLAVIPLCINRGINSPETQSEIVAKTMHFLDDLTYIKK